MNLIPKLYKKINIPKTIKLKNNIKMEINYLKAPLKYDKNNCKKRVNN